MSSNSADQAAPLQAAIASLLAHRTLLGGATVDLAVAALEDKLRACDEAARVIDGPVRQVLKLVSVLFLDVVGSTSLSQRLDPEDINEVMDGLLASCTTSVEQHQGRVLQYAGDSLLAVFGADGAAEDDAERAVRAGLALLEEGRRQGDRVHAVHGHQGLNVRVGVHTGGVLLGGGVDGENTIRGMTVNIAARLEQTAPPGALRISRETYAHVRGCFRVQEQDPMLVKGRDEPLQSFLVQGELSETLRRPSRGLAGFPTPHVGRDFELHRLQSAYAAAAMHMRMQDVAIVGEAGLGKTRLLAEFRAWTSNQTPACRLSHASALPASRRQPYGLMRQLLKEALKITDLDGPALACSKFEAGIARVFERDQAELAVSQAHVLGYLLGFGFQDSPHVVALKDAGQALRQRAFHVARAWFERTAAESISPLVLLLDDLHWADSASQQFFMEWPATARANEQGAPLLLVCCMRPSVFDDHGEWPVALSTSTPHIQLDALDGESSRSLAGALMSRLDAPSPRLHDALVSRAAGNPYYMEEILRMLCDEGVIERGAVQWRLHEHRLHEEAIPTTLTGVLQARLDSLPATAKTSLQGASVIGLRFWDAALAALGAALPGALAGLERRRLVQTRGMARFDAMHEYLFDHQILHEVTYGTVLKRNKRQWHLAIANWMAAHPDVDPDSRLAAIAEHYERGGDAASAAEHFVLGGEQAASRYAHHTVVALTTRGLALAATSARELRFRALHVRQRSLRVVGKMDAHADDVRELRCLAAELGDDRRLAAAGLSQAVSLFSSGDARGCVQACRAAMLQAKNAGADDVAAGIYSAWTGALRSLGAFDDIVPIVHEGLALARRIHDRVHESELLTILAAVATDRGDPLGAMALLGQSASIDRETGNTATEGPTLINLGDAAFRLGDHVQARKHMDAALALARAVGTRGFESICLLNLGSLCLFGGDLDKAIEHSQTAGDIAASIANAEYEAFAWMVLGHACLSAHRLDESDAAYVRSGTLLASMGMTHLSVEADAGRARVAQARGDAEAAGRFVDAILRHLDAHGTLDGCEHPLWIRLTCWQVLGPLNDRRAKEQLTTAHEELMLTAGRIADASARAMYLTSVPYHREIVSAWQAVASGSGRQVHAAFAASRQQGGSQA